MTLYAENEDELMLEMRRYATGDAPPAEAAPSPMERFYAAAERIRSGRLSEVEPAEQPEIPVGLEPPPDDVEVV
jgi:hypothetical protein